MAGGDRAVAARGDSAGGRWRLVHLRVLPEVLRQRLEGRARRFDANAAFPVTEDALAGYLAGFETGFEAPR